MYTLPVTCKQLCIISLCVMFAGGVYLMYDNYNLDDIPLFTLGMFVAGFPTVVGLVCFIWYGGLFVTKNVRCKCND